MKNYYDVLGVNEQSTSADITKAFKDLAKKHHPDRGGDKDRFQEISEAHDTLKNSQKRHDYDTMRKFGGTGTGGGQHPFFNEDIFGDFFSGFFLYSKSVFPDYSCSASCRLARFVRFV